MQPKVINTPPYADTFVMAIGSPKALMIYGASAAFIIVPKIDHTNVYITKSQIDFAVVLQLTFEANKAYVQTQVPIKHSS